MQCRPRGGKASRGISDPPIPVVRKDPGGKPTYNRAATLSCHTNDRCKGWVLSSQKPHLPTRRASYNSHCACMRGRVCFIPLHECIMHHGMHHQCSSVVARSHAQLALEMALFFKLLFRLLQACICCCSS